MMNNLVALVLVLLLTSSVKAASQRGADCFSGDRCGGPSTFGRVEECCNSPNISRSYQVQGGSELCEQCQFTYKCFVEEQCGSDDSSSTADKEETTHAINDGERVCCRGGQFRSWSVDSSSQCNGCPTDEPTTAYESSTILPKSTTLPGAITGGEKTDSKSQPQTTTPSNVDLENQLSKDSSSRHSQQCIAGVVVASALLAIVTFLY